MPEFDILLTFATICFMAILMPGPDVIFITSQAAFRGFKSGWLATLGVLAGLGAHIALASLGLTAIFATSIVAFEIMRWAGVAYLLYLSVKIIRTRTSAHALTAPSANNTMRIVTQGFFTNLLNPKAVLFFLALLPQFISTQQGSVFTQTLILGMEMLIIGAVVFSAMAYFVALSRTRVIHNSTVQRAQKWVFGSLLGGSAVWLALTENK